MNKNWEKKLDKNRKRKKIQQSVKISSGVFFAYLVTRSLYGFHTKSLVEFFSGSIDNSTQFPCYSQTYRRRRIHVVMPTFIVVVSNNLRELPLKWGSDRIARLCTRRSALVEGDVLPVVHMAIILSTISGNSTAKLSTCCAYISENSGKLDKLLCRFGCGRVDANNMK